MVLEEPKGTSREETVDKEEKSAACVIGVVAGSKPKETGVRSVDGTE